MKVKNKLPISIVVLTAFPLAVIALFSYTFMSQSSVSLYKKSLDNISFTVSMNFADYFKNQQNRIKAFSDISDYKKLTELSITQKDGEEYKKYLQDASEHMKIENEISDEYVYGCILNNQDEILVYEGVFNFDNITDLQSYKSIKSGEQKYLGIYEDANKNFYIELGAPIYDDNRNMQGMVIRFCNINYIKSYIQNLKFLESGYIYVIDGNGNTLSHYYIERLNDYEKSFDEAEQFFNLINNIKNNSINKDTDFINYKYNKEKITANYRKVPNSKLIVVAGIKDDEMYSEAKAVSKVIFIISINMLIISLLFGYITSVQITKPLTAIISKIKSIANGNLSERCENEGDDEFKELAQNINIMATNLEMDTIKLKRYAYIDGLTGLPNRTSIYKDIDKKFRKNKNQAVILLDLDKFKYINDNLGHQYGDETLKEVSKVLMKIKSDTCFPCRWGGDEFLVFVSDFNDKKELDFIAEYILKSIENLNLVSNNKIAFSTSIGIALLDEKDTDIIQIIKRADKAMYRVKNGRNDNKILYYTKAEHING